jgi:hypothetical protein
MYKVESMTTDLQVMHPVLDLVLVTRLDTVLVLGVDILKSDLIDRQIHVEFQ